MAEIQRYSREVYLEPTFTTEKAINLGLVPDPLKTTLSEEATSEYAGMIFSSVFVEVAERLCFQERERLKERYLQAVSRIDNIVERERDRLDQACLFKY